MQTGALAKLAPARRRLRRAIYESLACLAITAGLVAALEAGARVLGPLLIVVAALAGVRAVRAWWLDLDEQWFAAEVVLVTAGWALFASAFAGLQYLSFSLIPGAFFVEVDYGRMVSPRYRAEWLLDSTRAGGTLRAFEAAAALLSAGGPDGLAQDTTYAFPNGATLRLSERCEALLPGERCPWQLEITTGTGARTLELLLDPPEEGQRLLSRGVLQRALAQATDRLRHEVNALGRKLANPEAYVQPRIADFLYDTAIAFSGRDSGVFVPIGPVARLFHVLESLASYLLFGIVVSRVAAAAGARMRESGNQGTRGSE